MESTQRNRTEDHDEVHNSVSIEKTLQQFMQTHHLPETFAAHARQWFLPLADQIATHHQLADRTLVVGINGSQGSGKSTLASLLSKILPQRDGLKVIDLSIDDFYLTHAQRQHLGKNIHPLLATRGVPGTHDTDLLRDTLRALASDKGKASIPRFDKARDDRAPSDEWPLIDTPVDLVILEGWCLGVSAQDEQQLHSASNALEAQEDAQGVWRKYVNSELQSRYLDLYDMVDVWIMLQAPSFDSVYQWRLEQEQKLAEKNRHKDARIMSPEQVQRFIQHYQRLTEHALNTLPEQVNYLFKLNSQREIVELTHPTPVEL